MVATAWRRWGFQCHSALQCRPGAVVNGRCVWPTEGQGKRGPTLLLCRAAPAELFAEEHRGVYGIGHDGNGAERRDERGRRESVGSEVSELTQDHEGDAYPP